ncbi:MAG: phage head-tail connector protein [Rhizobiaceae bacterium]|nr:phage head-tail connector protein [Rhizobiaceae bacterium]
MTLFRTAGPDAEPVTLAHAKAELRVDHDSEDDLIEGLIRAAREEVEQTTGLAMIDQGWRLALDRIPPVRCVLIRRGPVRAITAVTAYGSDGEASVLEPSTYQLDSLSRPARMHFEVAPSDLRVFNGIEIDFTAGYGEAGTDVPDLLRRAVLMLVSHWFEFRASFGAGEQPVSLPDGYRRLLASFMARRLD